MHISTALKPARKAVLGAAAVAAFAGVIALPNTAHAASKPAPSKHENHVTHQSHVNHGAHQAHLLHMAHLNHLNHVNHQGHAAHLNHLNHQVAQAHQSAQAHKNHQIAQANAASRASSHKAHVIAQANAKARANSQSSRPAATGTPTSYSGSAQDIARQIVPADQFAAFSNIISRESGWNVHATNASSGAYGLAQALPGSKMASAGSDWRDNPATQIKWALDYMNSRYGSPNGAWAFWQAHNWY